MNETIKTIHARRSIRFYKDTQVSEADVAAILECAVLSPTGKGKQPWHFTVVRDRTLLDAITAGNKRLALESGDEEEIKKVSEPGFDNFRGAPVVIIVSMEDGQIYGEVDCACATTVMALAACSLGIDSCFIASFRDMLWHPTGKDCLDRLALPTGYTPVFALSLGYAAEDPHARRPRREGTVNYVG